MARARTLLGLALLISANVGCASDIDQVHYFRSLPDKDTHVPHNFYKVTVSGSTLWSSSRYLAGYFDESAVDSYFSEFSQPEKGKFPLGHTTSTAANPEKPKTSSPEIIEPLDSKLRGTQLIMILSSNSDEVAAQIGAIADNKKLGLALSRLLNKDKLLTARQLDQDAKLLTSRQRDLAATGKGWIGDLDENVSKESKDTARGNTLQYLNEIAAVLGNTVPFKTPEDATKWLDSNWSKILND